MASEFPGTACGRWRLRQRDGVVRRALGEDLWDLLEMMMGAEKKGIMQQVDHSIDGFRSES